MNVVDILPRGTWSPARPDAAERIDVLERRVGHALPSDLRELHLRCRNVVLGDDRYVFLEPERMQSIGQLQAGDSTDDHCPRTWLAIVDLHDGNYVGVDLIANADGTHNWLDCDHEDLGRATVIATSLEELVREALSWPDGLFWLQADHKPYRRIEYENPPSYWRRLHGEWYATLGEERGPELCTATGCARLHIVQSVKCRRHHYEMVHHRPSPFDDG